MFTDPLASPTGYPFKVVQLPGTLAEADLYQARERICDLGYLRHLYRKPDGSIGYRCPAEPAADYLAKGGDASELAGRKCVCNGLPATIGHAQPREAGWSELPLVTAGDDVAGVARMLPEGADGYSAAHVIRMLLEESEPATRG